MERIKSYLWAALIALAAFLERVSVSARTSGNGETIVQIRIVPAPNPAQNGAHNVTDD